MTRNERPRFTTLVDWLEGRLTAEESAQVAALVDEGDPETTETVDWIREFLDAARTLRLPAPPPELARRLRRVYSDHMSPWRDDDFSDAELVYDDRLPSAASGLRSAVSGDLTHLVFRCDLGRLVLDIYRTSPAEVDIRGYLALDSDRGSGEAEVSVRQRGALCGAAHPAGDGEFEVCGVPDSIDELWVIHGDVKIRADLQLRRP